MMLNKFLKIDGIDCQVCIHSPIGMGTNISFLFDGKYKKTYSMISDCHAEGDFGSELVHALYTRLREYKMDMLYRKCADAMNGGFAVHKCGGKRKGSGVRSKRRGRPPKVK